MTIPTMRHLESVALLLLACSITENSVAISPETKPAAAPAPPMCEVSQLALSTDSEGGFFNGMSQSGTLVVLRNVGPNACRVEPFARFTLQDSSGKEIAFTTTVPNTRGMHPGPVVLPIPLASGAELTSTLHWISGPVFPQSFCVQPNQLILQIGDSKLITEFGTNICGEKGKRINIDRTRFAPDPVYTPAPVRKP